MSPSGLEVKGSDQSQHLSWLDVVGATAESTTLNINTCKKDNKGHRHLDTFVFNGQGSDDVNEFAQAIRYMARFPGQHNPTLPSIEQMAEQAPPLQKCLVLINPVGGTGHAESTYDRKVHNVLEAANIVVTKVLTTHQAHAMEIAETLDLTEYNFLVCVGGDGLEFEVVQGLMQRSDWHDAIRFPMGIIPGGSGNGLAKTLLHNASEVYSPENRAFIIAKASPQSLDIATTRNATSTRYSFLSLSWAFIADVDFESEWCRFMGSTRFTVAAVMKILTFKRWKGRLSYLLPDKDAEPQHYWNNPGNNEPSNAPVIHLLPKTIGGALPNKWATMEGNFSLFWSTSVSHPTWDAHLVPGASSSDGYLYLVVVEGDASVMTMTKVLLGLETGSHTALESVQVIKTRQATHTHQAWFVYLRLL
ncbi:hypothetical protein H310_01443 [Aphanomyces invadans]|uniref:DAGKc domain-containing protein n=1 Tax=Aphanomyces invadans TaxID=157072 RepID=A0A024USP6_9STRA|nr:hypothetical protein H310_01443 [Aphanomyces invadans]ETW08965.1 hypothetical protein H310_01443 [Aphanomyces invadans]|eukprot:XP_008862770.1 hypothetical protein H310_01443 [Aphanomyces invadans]